jgi:sorting nexin-8
VWRKQATISVSEEFTDKALPPDLEDSLPPNLDDTFDTVRAGVKRSAEIYIQLCTLVERLARRNEGLAADSLRFSLALTSLTESSLDTHAIDASDVSLLNDGLGATAKHLSTSQTLLEEEARTWETGALEDLKQRRDALVGMRDLFDRHDRLARDTIPALEKRITTCETRLHTLHNQTATPTDKTASEIAKLESAIFRDKEAIVAQHARGVLIRECVRDEIGFFSGADVVAVARLVQDWTAERVKFAELQAACWRGLADEVENMPGAE